MNGLVRCLALAASGLALLLLVPHDLLHGPTIPLFATRVTQPALVGLALLLTGWLYATSLVLRRRHSWRGDAAGRTWAILFLVLCPAALVCAALDGLPLAAGLSVLALVALIAWANSSPALASDQR